MLRFICGDIREIKILGWKYDIYKLLYTARRVILRNTYSYNDSFDRFSEQLFDEPVTFLQVL
ncbi:unnamed protein product [Schistosoma mansoni]|uniref:Smp_201290 n=1 Tax=Schistosoma mansoni TaxID=6183 RepID=UPI00022C86C6|nr:unnamed protein product [Schistosoma mansoni]|eukprot:XP_018645124.1 unnamed protein product [Schistosoma mansoni]